MANTTTRLRCPDIPSSRLDQHGAHDAALKAVRPRLRLRALRLDRDAAHTPAQTPPEPPGKRPPPSPISYLTGPAPSWMTQRGAINRLIDRPAPWSGRTRCRIPVVVCLPRYPRAAHRRQARRRRRPPRRARRRARDHGDTRNGHRCRPGHPAPTATSGPRTWQQYPIIATPTATRDGDPTPPMRGPDQPPTGTCRRRATARSAPRSRGAARGRARPRPAPRQQRD